MSNKTSVSFRCYFPGAGNTINHYQLLTLEEIPKWLEAYSFTHPNVEAITVKVWFHGKEVRDDAEA